jgi:hypothetical protein
MDVVPFTSSRSSEEYGHGHSYSWGSDHDQAAKSKGQCESDNQAAEQRLAENSFAEALLFAQVRSA